MIISYPSRVDSTKRKHVAIAAGNTIVNYYHEILGRPKVTPSVTADHISAMTYDPLKGTFLSFFFYRNKQMITFFF